MGSLSEVSAYPRLVLETALNYNAHSALLSHNHPGGTCAPSTDDVTSTLQLQQLLNGVGILVLDHIIIAGDRTYMIPSKTGPVNGWKKPPPGTRCGRGPEAFVWGGVWVGRKGAGKKRDSIPPFLS